MHLLEVASHGPAEGQAPLPPRTANLTKYEALPLASFLNAESCEFIIERLGGLCAAGHLYWSTKPSTNLGIDPPLPKR